MTAVLFKFAHPDGTPVVDTPFVVSLHKSSFDENLDIGILLPGDTQGVTDAQGTATLELVPGFGIYYLTMSAIGATENSDGCVAGLRYRFQVPVSASPVRVEDIIVTTPTFSRPWDEVALQVIIDAKAAAVGAANEAEAARDVALEQTGIIDGIAEETRTAAAAALVSRDQASGFATSASASKDAAAASVAATHADVLLTHADVITTVTNKNAAAASAIAAQTSAVASDAAAVRSETAATQAETAATTATTAKNTAVTKASEASASAAQVTADKAIVLTAKDVTLAARDQAVEAAQTVVGALVEAGGIDLSGGAYPAKPSRATIWKVQVGGVVTGDHGDTYGVGDSLVYSKAFDYFYKIDNTENVSSVNGKTGVVVLVKADVGLGNVDNTSDVNKPLSTAAAAGLGLKIDKTSIVDDLTSIDPSKVLSAKQGKLLYDMLQANNATITRYTYNLTAGQTVVSGADTAGVVLSYVPGTVMLVELNGFPLYKTNDYTATTGTSLTLTTAAEAVSELAITVFGTFTLANHYTKAESDAKFSTVQTVLDETSRENVIINGNFSLWQRGTSFVDPAHFTTTVDRFVFGQSSGTAKFTIAQSTDVPNAQSQYSLDIAVTQAYTPTANDEAHIRYGLEGREGLVKVAGKVVTYSFWAKSNVVGVHSLVMVHPNSTRSSEETWPAEYTILVANTWEKKTITVDLSTASGGWSYAGNNYGLKIRFCFYAGTGYRAQPGQWTTGNYVGSVNQVNLAGTVGNYLRIAQFKLEAGSKATVFAPEDISDTLRQCQRYFYLIGGTGDVFGLASYAGGAGDTVYAPFTFPTTMSKVPVVTTSGLFAVANTVQPTFNVSQTGGFISLAAIAAGRVAARSNGIYIYFDAEF
jgi:hypothetical protein